MHPTPPTSWLPHPHSLISVSSLLSFFILTSKPLSGQRLLLGSSHDPESSGLSPRHGQFVWAPELTLAPCVPPALRKGTAAFWCLRHSHHAVPCLTALSEVCSATNRHALLDLEDGPSPGFSSCFSEYSSSSSNSSPQPAPQICGSPEFCPRPSFSCHPSQVPGNLLPAPCILPCPGGA